jgi:hypothetical protein
MTSNPDMQNAGSNRWSWFDRVRAAWRVLRGKSPARRRAVPSNGPFSGPAGCVIVRARCFGKTREVRLVAVRGFHVISESCDAGPQSMYLLTAGQVLPEFVPAFRQFQENGPRG